MGPFRRLGEQLAVQHADTEDMGDRQPQCLVTELTTLQRQIIKLLGLSPADYGR